ncbi:MAG: universal stress protein [Desulfomonilaceae bacterium]|nr:universal stress protein [Desulfomonilaceae bacterium]
MKRFKNILYVSEATVDQASAVARAVTLAENNQADLTVVDVVPHGGDDVAADLTTSRRQALESLIEPHRHRLEIPTHVLAGTAFLEVIRAVLRNDHDLVIKAEEPPDSLDMMFGSDDMHLLRRCPCPVWLMKPPEKTNYNCILAAVDFDPLQSSPTEQALNREIIELACSLALSDFASLHLVHAWEPYAEGIMRGRGDMTGKTMASYIEREHIRHQEGLYRLGETLREHFGADAYDYLGPRFHLLRGPARKLIPVLAEELRADLVVMGTVARTGISGLIIGNTAESILSRLTCSILAVKPPGFTTPVKPAD